MVGAVSYTHLDVYKRQIDMSGMYVLVERGNVVRYFMKDDAVQGNSAELAGFLTEKCHLPMEQITVR